MKHQMPVEQHGKITYAHLKSAAVEFSATDWLHPVHQPKQGNMTAMYVTSNDVDDLQPVFDKLAVGANPEFFVALMDMPFGKYGRMTDRFGIEWFFRGEPSTA